MATDDVPMTDSTVDEWRAVLADVVPDSVMETEAGAKMLQKLVEGFGTPAKAAKTEPAKFSYSCTRLLPDGMDEEEGGELVSAITKRVFANQSTSLLVIMVVLVQL